MSRVCRPAALLILLLALPGTAVQAQTLPEVVIGIVKDGPQSRAMLTESAIFREIDALLSGEFRVRMGEETLTRGDWTIEGARRALRQQFANPEIDVVITLGVLSTQAAADMASLPKPVIGVMVADSGLQGFPLDGGVSGKRNFVYLTNFRSIETQVRAFRRAVEFRRLAVLVDANTLAALPALAEEKPRELSELIGAEVRVIPVGDSLDDVAPRLDGFDAVYLTPLLRFGGDELRRLAASLSDRGLPSFSLLGGPELDLGFLLSMGGGEREVTIISRRIALNVQRILLGDDPSTIPVAIDFTDQLTINMAAAAELGYEPSYAIMADAELVNEVERTESGAIGFSEVLVLAARQNRSLRAAAFGPDLARADYAGARSRLLPQLGFGATRTRIDADRANPLVQPEKSTDLQVTGRQLLYSDDVVADWQASDRLVDASVLDFRAQELDVVQSAGEAYLQVLRADALFRVRQENLATTRENLQLARVRERIGFSGRSDLLRWESQLARERRDVIAAEAALNQALVRLGQVLGVSQSEPPRPVDEALDAALTFFRSAGFARLISTPSAWERFKAFLVSEALAQAPELAALDERIAAQERQRKAARRKFYLPEVALQAAAGERVSAGGAGSDTSLFTQDDRSWSVSLTADWPIFTGGALRSRLTSADLQLAQLAAQRIALEERVEARMRIALENVGSSYTSIELSEEAARAARENLGIVADAYAQGAASITDLLDAQDASLNADLGAADARYAYFIDLMSVLRAAADFRLVLEPGYRGTFVDRASRYVQRPESPGEQADADRP